LVRPVPSPRRVLKGGYECFATVVPEDEFVEVDLELRLARSVVVSD
jgi:hypothetical protein